MQVKFESQGHRSRHRREKFAEKVGATSREGFSSCNECLLIYYFRKKVTRITNAEDLVYIRLNENSRPTLKYSYGLNIGLFSKIMR